LSYILRYEDSRGRHLSNVQCSDMVIRSRFLYNMVITVADVYATCWGTVQELE